ncbi:MAG: hypothetical protein EBT93_15120, partial [Alphaproteobacteria bacterium]|nr:hypothetical protein [Alphaproteobacteria bacterium]
MSDLHCKDLCMTFTDPVSGGKVEAEGIRRAQNAAADADFLVIVLDASAANWPEQLAELQGWGSAGKLVLLNKADQATAAEKARITAHFEGGELDAA